MTLAGAVDEAAGQFGARTAIQSELACFTYDDLARRKNQYARWAQSAGLHAGDVVALLMGNSPEYVAIWLGITQIGCIAAMLNTNLKGDALVQAIQAAAPVQLIADREFAPALDGIADALPKIKLALANEPPGQRKADQSILNPTRFDDAPLGVNEKPGVLARQTALLIFTSGTSGMPKAAKVSHYRLLEWSLWFAGMMNLGPDDSIYNCLPLYHSTGGVVGIGSALLQGANVVLRRRFSASRFWDDVTQHRCTHFLYIGELCRYLVAAPHHPDEARHNLRLCCGNGLRKDVWEAFVERFNIPQILEFYASTEGNVSLYNCEGRPGAIGRVPAFLAHRFPVALIECDAVTGTPFRDANGKCIVCRNGAVGEAIGEIRDADDAGPRRFEGYADEAATSSKILRDVFKPGDAWFRTGDLMQRDAAGFYYFVDRIGDTFRWKGENVSTAQVAEALCNCRGVTGAVVYGVTVPGAEGRAGMAAITVDQTFDLARLHADVVDRLPSYARPMFLRIRDTLDTTGTFKPIKASLMQEGYATDVVADPLFVADPAAGTYRALKEGVLF